MPDQDHKENTPVVPKEKLTLSDFLEDNQKLVTVLGVFTALTVFAASIPLPPFRNILSFLFMSLAILVWIELWRKFPKGNYAWRLRWFDDILTLSVLALVCYWFIGFSEMWQGYFVLALNSISLAVFGFLNKRFRVYQILFDPQFTTLRRIRRVTWIVFLIAWFGASTYFGTKISPSIGKWLNNVHQQMLSSKP